MLNFSHVKVINKLLKIALLRERVFLAVFTFFCLFCTCDFFTLLCYIGMKLNLFCRKKIKRDFLHGRKNFAKNYVINIARYFSHLPTYTTCSSQDSYAYDESRHDSYSQFSRSPLGTTGTMADQLGKTEGKKMPAFLESRSAKASSTNR